MLDNTFVQCRNNGTQYCRKCQKICTAWLRFICPTCPTYWGNNLNDMMFVILYSRHKLNPFVIFHFLDHFTNTISFFDAICKIKIKMKMLICYFGKQLMYLIDWCIYILMSQEYGIYLVQYIKVFKNELVLHHMVIEINLLIFPFYCQDVV